MLIDHAGLPRTMLDQFFDTEWEGGRKIDRGAMVTSDPSLLTYVSLAHNESADSRVPHRSLR